MRAGDLLEETASGHSHNNAPRWLTSRRTSATRGTRNVHLQMEIKTCTNRSGTISTFGGVHLRPCVQSCEWIICSGVKLRPPCTARPRVQKMQSVQVSGCLLLHSKFSARAPRDTCEQHRRFVAVFETAKTFFCKTRNQRSWFLLNTMQQHLRLCSEFRDVLLGALR